MKRVLFYLSLIIGHPVLFGQNWVPLDEGIDCFYSGDVKDMFVDTASDKLYISGIFNHDGNCLPLAGVAMWNGSQWDSLGSTFASTIKYGIYLYRDSLYVYGDFSGTNVYYWGRWNGTSWDSVSSVPNAPVMCYAERGDSLFLGGYFDHCGSDSTFLLGVYDGQQVTGISQYCGVQGGWLLNAMVFYNDTLYVGGNFSTWPCSPSFHDFGKWDGTSSILPVDPLFEMAPALIEDMVVYQNELYIGGWFRQEDGYPSSYIMKYDGQQLSAVGGGANERVTAMKVHNGELYIGGYFSQVGNVQSKQVAKWNGSQWFSLSTDSLTGSYPLVQDIDFYRDSLIISGNFRAINGDSSMQRIAKYNHALTTGMPALNNEISVTILPNPATDVVKFQFTGTSAEPRNVSICDAFGREIYHIETTESDLDVSLNGFANGVYFYSISGQSDLGTQGKFVVAH